MIAPLLILAVGNESRGDDAIAPLLQRRLANLLDEMGCAVQCELLEAFQLQVEHAVDMLDRDLVLFIDAGVNMSAPYSFRRVWPDDGGTLFSHALLPQAVLATYVRVYRKAPPPSFVLCVHGEQFGLGEDLSRQARQHMELAFKFMQMLLQKAEASIWEGCCT